LHDGIIRMRLAMRAELEKKPDEFILTTLRDGGDEHRCGKGRNLPTR
jgi:hypothetical protein